MSNSTAALLPERVPNVGELVQVRSRRWIVEEVVEPEYPRESSVVRLACVDDDNQGQSLEVFWDYEPDRLILADEGWDGLAAKGFDEPRQFAAFLHTLRWNCTTATDARLFQAPFRAGITIDAYQMEPLRKALALPRVNLLIADDTGLGKTIEAGLIARELLLRRKAKSKSIVVAAPPSMLEQWRSELEERFGLVFEILDRAYVSRMRRERGFGVNPWRTHSRFLVSHNLLIDSASDQLVRRFTDRFWRTDWPGEARPAVFYDPRSLDIDGPIGVLHAMAVVVDDDSVFVTSANLTEAAFDRNIELGVLMRDRLLAVSITRHFQGLIDHELLRALPES